MPNVFFADPPYNQLLLPPQNQLLRDSFFDAEAVLAGIRDLYDKREEVEKKLTAARRVLAMRRERSLNVFSQMTRRVHVMPRTRPRRAAEDDII